MLSEYTPTLSPSLSRKIQSRRRWPRLPYRRAIYRQRIRQSTAVKFKIYLKTRCSPAMVSYSNPLISPKKIRSQWRREDLSSAVRQQHFSSAFPILLPVIAARLHKQRDDYASINGLLASVNSLFINFRDTFSGDDYLPADLKYCLDNFAKPLSDLFNLTARMIDQKPDSPRLKLYIESQRLCCSIFYSLNFHEVPEFFKDHMSVWMVEFHNYITLDFPVVDELALADLRAAVCEGISIYVIKEDELLFQQGYLSGFVESVLSLVVSPSSHGRKQLIVGAIKFLTAVSKSRHHILLSSDVILHQICQSIVIPTVMLHDVDEELFEMNPKEFIRKHIEGSNIGTMTRISCELLKGIATHYKDKVTKEVRLQTDRCESRFRANREGNWKYMYRALYLVISLGTDSVDLKPSCPLVLVKELYNEDVTSFPMLKAISLKFLISFRNQIIKPNALHALPCVIRLLTSPNYVVHSVAAWCIEELLLVKEERVTLPDDVEELLLQMKDDSMRRQYRSYYELRYSRAGYTSKDICPILPKLMSNLFGALNNRESEENPYVMKCIMRVVLVGDLTADVASLCIQRLTAILHKVCQNPKNPSFNDYLFESLSGLIRRVCFLSKEMKGRPRKEEISLVSLLEKKLYPILQMILTRDITKFFTYAFRLLAELVYLDRPLLSTGCYSQVFDILRLPDTWMYQAKGFLPHELSFPSVIYSKLVSSSAIDVQGYYVLNTVIENLGFEAISPFVRHIWVSLFNRLQNKRVLKSQDLQDLQSHACAY